MDLGLRVGIWSWGLGLQSLKQEFNPRGWNLVLEAEIWSRGQNLGLEARIWTLSLKLGIKSRRGKQRERRGEIATYEKLLHMRNHRSLAPLETLPKKKLSALYKEEFLRFLTQDLINDRVE